MPESEYAGVVIVGRIRKAQGIRGEVIVESLTDTPGVIFTSGVRVYAGTVDGDATDKQLTISHAKPFKSGFIVKFAEIPDRNEAELWRGRYLLMQFADIPKRQEGEVYLHELIGLTLQSSDAEVVGTVTGFYELPQGLMLDVETMGGSALIPYRPEIIKEVDLDTKTITALEGVEDLWR